MKLLCQIWLVFLFTTCLSAQGTYPLQIGNVWQYRDSYDSTYGWTNKAVKDTIMSNGYTYTMLVTDDAIGPLFRQEGAKVFFYGRYPTSDTTYHYYEELWYDFSKTRGDTVRVTVHDYPPNTKDTITVRVIEDRMMNVFGKMRRTWLFYETSKRTSGYALRQIADSIGMISTRGEAGTAFSLFGAIINGIKYGTITQVEYSPPSVPITYLVYQNYPNPFNPSTTIEFKIPNEKHVTLVVYNILGEQIRNLFEGNMSPGLHHVVWDGKNIFGVHVGSGVFFYQIKTDDFIETKKMMLLR